MSLSLLLDYRQEDNKEHSFEVSLFAELFNEMLIRDFGFNIYRALLEAPEQKEEKKKDGGKESDKKGDRRDDRKSDRRRDRKDDEKKTDDQDESDAASEQSDGEGDSEENKGNRGLLMKSEDGLPESNATEPSAALDSAGGAAGAKLVFHDGALLDVGKLLRQVERSERARTSSETRLKELIEALAEVRESWEASRQEVLKTQIDLDQARRQLVVVEDDLCSSRKAAQELRLALQNCRQHLQATLGSLETVLGRKEHRGDTKNDD
ncbi:hypothetical protein HPB52_011768 [Rhipicephalus sanguineus]|uniref:LAIKA domain-containing protein n=1 Tax=Rhipicephalus sanguineus TaxID=34632 RepID=A0A9D4YPL1_RHISA|nr:hypothetical protein HPB52_011768 [Rhipicephalus sanguineus]